MKRFCRRWALKIYAAILDVTAAILDVVAAICDVVVWGIKEVLIPIYEFLRWCAVKLRV
jgi:hypothetical protein